MSAEEGVTCIIGSGPHNTYPERYKSLTFCRDELSGVPYVKLRKQMRASHFES